MLTLDVLLALADGRPPDALDAPLAAEAGRLAGKLPSGTTIRVVHSLAHHRGDAEAAGDPLGRLEELLETGLPPAHTRVPITSFDAALEAVLPDGTDPGSLVAAVDGLVGRLGGTVDAARSAVVVGQAHTIIDGPGAVQLFYCMRRVPALTHEQFSDYWRHQLIEHTTKTPGKTGYRQLHADPATTARAAAAAGAGIDDIDGVALEWYPDMAAFCSAVDWADEPQAGIIRAETQMNDFGRALSVLGYGTGADETGN